jgi:hypothetical protein
MKFIRSRWTIGLVLSVAHVLVVPVAPVTTKTTPQMPMLVITEIMLHPLDATNQSTQWLEVFNPSNETLDLEYATWVACQGSSSGRGLPQEMTCDYIALENDGTLDQLIAANGYLVIGNNNDRKTNGNVSVDILFNFRPFPKDGSGFNYIAFYCDRRRRQQRRLNEEYEKISDGDSIHWNTNPPVGDKIYTNYPFVPGASLAKINATDFDYSRGSYEKWQIASNWRSSTTPIRSCGLVCDDGGDKGTPGRYNNLVADDNDKSRSPGRTTGTSNNRVASKRPSLPSPFVLVFLLPVLPLIPLLISIFDACTSRRRIRRPPDAMEQIEMKDLRPAREYE